jgi:hypothetical protein
VEDVEGNSWRRESLSNAGCYHHAHEKSTVAAAFAQPQPGGWQTMDDIKKHGKPYEPVTERQVTFVSLFYVNPLRERGASTAQSHFNVCGGFRCAIQLIRCFSVFRLCENKLSHPIPAPKCLLLANLLPSSSVHLAQISPPENSSDPHEARITTCLISSLRSGTEQQSGSSKEQAIPRSMTLPSISTMGALISTPINYEESVTTFHSTFSPSIIIH